MGADVAKAAVAKTATFVRKVDGLVSDARLYRMSPPLVDPTADAAYEYVIVSAAELVLSGPETAIFAATADGHIDVSGPGDLVGSYRGGLDHERALNNAGYTITAVPALTARPTSTVPEGSHGSDWSGADVTMIEHDGVWRGRQT